MLADRKAAFYQIKALIRRQYPVEKPYVFRVILGKFQKNTSASTFFKVCAEGNFFIQLLLIKFKILIKIAGYHAVIKLAHLVSTLAVTTLNLFI